MAINSTFKVYKYDTVLDSPEVVISHAHSGRLGDKITAYGSTADNSFKIYAASAGTNNDILVFSTLDNGVTFTADTLNPADVTTTGGAATIGMALNGEFYYNYNGISPKKYQADGALIGQIPGSVISSGTNAIELLGLNGTDEIVAIYTYGAGNENARIVRVKDGVPADASLYAVTNTLGTNSNANGAGDVAFKKIDDYNYNVYVLSCNNGLGAYKVTLPVPPVAPEKMVSNWEVFGDKYNFFLSAGDAARGMGYDAANGKVLIASRAGGTAVRVLDANTGAVVDTLDMTGVTGGYYGISLMKVDVADDGAIYACNLENSTTANFKVYRWEDYDAVPTVALDVQLTGRFGDVLEVYGGGTDTKIYASARDGSVIKIFGTEDGLTFAEERTVPIATAAANGGISIVDGEKMWINAAWKDMQLIDTTGAVLKTVGADVIETYYGSIQYVMADNNAELLITNTNHSEGNRRKVKVVNVSVEPAEIWAYGETGNIEMGNGNVAGNIKYSLNPDGTVELFTMATNNAIARWTLTEVPEPSVMPTLIFSEYIEGSSNNKALELYNATNGALDLTDYIIKVATNGSGWQATYYSFPEGATLAAGDVYVIANNQAVAWVLDVADEILAYNEGAYVVSFNGNDARGLFKVDGADTTLIDVIGVPTENANWAVAGVDAATKDHTLVRKAAIETGNFDWLLSAGTDADNSEWLVYEQNTFAYLGTHNETIVPRFQLTHDPVAPTSSDEVTISLAVLDDGIVSNVKLFYGLSESAMTNEVTLTETEGVYSGTIPAQAHGTVVYFYATADDDDNNTGTSVTMSYQVQDVTIYDIVINEIHYNNPGDDTLEFVELYNNDDVAVDMSGYTFSDGIEFTFPENTVLPAGDFLVVAVNAVAFEAFYGFAPDFQWTSGALSNSGERLAISNATGHIVDSLTYSDKAAWPTEPDGDGPSLELLDPNLDNSNPANWVASWKMGGTPKAPNNPTMLIVSEEELPFPPTAVHGASSVQFFMANLGGGEVTVDSIRVNDDYFSSNVVDGTVIGSRDTLDVTVVFAPDTVMEAVVANLALYTSEGNYNLAITASSYNLWPLEWRMAAGDPNTEWFWAPALQHYVRALAYNQLNNHIYVVSRIGGPKIYILEGETGAVVGQLDNTGIAQNGATFHVNTIAVTEDGQILVASLGRTPEIFNLYHYANEMAAPSWVYSKDATIVAGDALGVAGTGTNLTVFSAGHWSTAGNNDHLNKMLVLETTDLGNWTETLVDLVAPRDANYGISPVGNGDYLFVNGTSATGPLYMKKDGTVLYNFSPVGTSVEYFEVETSSKGTRRFVAFTNGWSSGVHVAELFGEPGDNLCSSYEFLEAPTENYATISNGNATGMAVYNRFNNSIVELITNNGISSYSLDLVVPDAVVPAIPVMSVEPRMLDFEIVVGASALNFTISNIGTADLVIDSIMIDSPVLTTNLVPETIAAAQEASYTLTASAEGLDGQFEAVVTIYAANGMDFVTAKGEVINVEGSVINEDFAAWSGYGYGWSGTNVTLRTDGYGNGDANYIGSPDASLNQPIIIITPKVMNPEKVLFHYAEYSGSGADDWTLTVALSPDGETWTDTLGVYENPNNLDWHMAVLPIEADGAYHIGFLSSEVLSGGIFLDDVMIDGAGLAIEGTALSEDFETWSEIPATWGTSNIVLYDDNYSHSGTKYLGAENLGQAHYIRTSGFENPTHISFWYAQYSNSGDNWELKVVLSEQGEAWTDTIAILNNPGNLDWKYVDLPVNKSGKFYLGFLVDGTVEGGLFLDDLKVDAAGTFVGIEDLIPAEFALDQNYPNPFNPMTTIPLALPEASKVNLVVYNVLGQQIATIYNGHLEAGYYNFPFHIGKLASGLYFYKVEANDFTSVKKMMILK